jgi:hypothetical protein
MCNREQWNAVNTLDVTKRGTGSSAVLMRGQYLQVVLVGLERAHLLCKLEAKRIGRLVEVAERALSLLVLLRLQVCNLLLGKADVVL